jgi:hypothetical protein
MPAPAVLPPAQDVVVEDLNFLNEICVRLRFWKLVLQILANASISAQLLEQHAMKYWKKIIDKVVNKDASNFPALKEEIKLLGDRHAGHDGIFPTKGLCRLLDEKAWAHHEEVGSTWVVDTIVQIRSDKFPRQTMFHHIYDAFYGFWQDPEPNVGAGDLARQRLKREIWTLGSLARIFTCCQHEAECGEDTQFLEQVRPAATAMHACARPPPARPRHLTTAPLVFVAAFLGPAFARLHQQARHDGATKCPHGPERSDRCQVLEECVRPRLAEPVMRPRACALRAAVSNHLPQLGAATSRKSAVVALLPPSAFLSTTRA